MRYVAAAAGALVVGFLAASLAGRLAVALRHLRNAILMRRKVMGLRDAAYSSELAVASALLSAAFGAVLAHFTTTTSAALVGGLAPSAVFLVLVLVTCAYQAFTLT